MTSPENSSNRTRVKRLQTGLPIVQGLDQIDGIETLAGVFHPHAIEVQDFAHYARILDLRSAPDYANDHIPGAIHCALSAAQIANPAAALRAVAALCKGGERGDATLIYCGHGGAVSEPLAAALRQQERRVDVLPGGWINYRQWVQAGVEMLPRLLALRVMECRSSGSTAPLLRALRVAGLQVLDMAVLTTQPTSQAWFDSRLLCALRKLDARQPVWLVRSDTPGPRGPHGAIDVQGARVATVAWPGALLHAIDLAPTWPALMSDEAQLTGGAEPPSPLPLVIESLETELLVSAVRRWLPKVQR
jgi:tRNA 2-selenouridine synthase